MRWGRHGLTNILEEWKRDRTEHEFLEGYFIHDIELHKNYLFVMEMEPGNKNMYISSDCMRYYFQFTNEKSRKQKDQLLCLKLHRAGIFIETHAARFLTAVCKLYFSNA